MLICLSVYQEDRCGLLSYLVYADIHQYSRTHRRTVTCAPIIGYADGLNKLCSMIYKNLERCQFIVEETWFGARLLLKSLEQMGRFLNPVACQ